MTTLQIHKPAVRREIRTRRRTHSPFSGDGDKPNGTYTVSVYDYDTQSFGPEHVSVKLWELRPILRELDKWYSSHSYAIDRD